MKVEIIHTELSEVVSSCDATRKEGIIEVSLWVRIQSDLSPIVVPPLMLVLQPPPEGEA